MKEETCGDTESWCTFISEFECEDNQVQGNCSKTCNQCNGNHRLV